MKLILPKPHAGQQIILDQRNKNNVAACGRRFGKTALGKLILAGKGGVLHGLPCGWLAPNYRYLAQVWREIVEDFASVIVAQNKTDKFISFIGGGQLEFFSLENQDAGKSRKFSTVIIDEAELVKDLEYSWEQAIEPTLLDYDGDSWLLSSPQGEGYFKTLFDRGQSDDPLFKYWSSWQMPTSANPTIPNIDRLLAEKKILLPDLVYQQEYLAQFVDFAGTIIKAEWIKYGTPDPKMVCSTSVGVDLAISLKETACYTAFVCMQATIDGKLWVVDALKKRLPFNETIVELTNFAHKWDADVVNVESVAYQAAVVQEMVRTTKLNIRPVIPNQGEDKLMRFMILEPRYKHGLISHAPGLIPEFKKDVLGFPSTGENDLPDAFYYAYKGLRMPLKSGVSAGRREVNKLIDDNYSRGTGGWGSIGNS